MTVSVDHGRVTALRRAAVRATRAPSVHNTQPWRLVMRPRVLEVHADWHRQLTVLDPRGRQLLMSCGCAVFNARVALAAAGVPVSIERVADSSESITVARIVADGDCAEVEHELAPLDPMIEVRQTNRRRFADDDVPDVVLRALAEAARTEGAELFPVLRAQHRFTVARLSQLADRIENADPAYRAELRRWTTDDPSRMDGVPATAVPHVDGLSGDDVPLRDFDTHGAGELPAQTRSSSRQCLVLLGTIDDGAAAWLRAGEALERVLLEVARFGFTASPLTQVIEVPATHAALRNELGLAMHPHILLRIGHASATPATRRRRLVDVLVEAD